jgi:hypothetical protein
MQGDGIVAAWFAGFSIRHRRGCCLLFLTLPLVYGCRYQKNWLTALYLSARQNYGI